VKENKLAAANKFDKKMALLLLVIYVGLNFYFIWQATIS
jgi:hypothetical protein